uniref:Uncharacterized protein n=1 Tax=uncultured haloarchaeon TaxID=160804 RepID=A5YSQ5_9EURY|nr:hypothetical protein [uncultured haloarchaeon]
MYGANTDVEEITYTLAGFVSPDLTTAAETWRKPDKDRSIDIGYRSRRLPYYLGDAGRHKSQIGIRFNEHLSNSDLSTDISVEYRDRLYGDDWWQFLGNCRACLGTEGGSSTFDLDGSLFEHHKEVMDSNPSISYDEYKEQVLSEYNRDIGYRTITPRHFEYAAFRCCQILLEGEYSGVLEPDCHYIPVKRDYSNLEEVLNKYRDPAVRSRLTENAYTDLIVSDEYTYKSFIQSFDEMLRQKGFQPGKSATLRDTRQTYKRSLRRQKQREWLESVISRAIGAVRRRGDRALQLLSR